MMRYPFETAFDPPAPARTTTLTIVTRPRPLPPVVTLSDAWARLDAQAANAIRHAVDRVLNERVQRREVEDEGGLADADGWAAGQPTAPARGGDTNA